MLKIPPLNRGIGSTAKQTFATKHLYNRGAIEKKSQQNAKGCFCLWGLEIV